MTKRRRPKQPKHLGQAPAEQAVANTVSRRHRHETADAPSARDRLFRRCPTCGVVAYDGSGQTTLEQMTDTAQHPLAGFARLHDHAVDEDGKPNLRRAWIAYCDNAKGEVQPQIEDFERTMAWMWNVRPIAAAFLTARWEHRRSNRDIAAELGSHHDTIEATMNRAIFVFKEALSSGKVA